MVSSIIRPKHRFYIGNTPHIYGVTGDGRWNISIKGQNKKLFKKAMRRIYKKIRKEDIE